MTACDRAHGPAERFEIIVGMLTETRHAGIAVKPRIPARIKSNFGVDLPPREGVDQKRTDGIRSVI